ncbi:MAG: winged helix-turn-helix domain-containing protein [bacterium]
MIDKILWIEGKRADSPSFVPTLRKKQYEIELVPTGKAALDRLLEVDPYLVVVNAASLRSNGKRICANLRDKMNGLPIMLILDKDQPISGEIAANIVLRLPFTPRKLINRIIPFIANEGKHAYKKGAIILDLERKSIQCEDRGGRLTPRLVKLIHKLMRHAGEVIAREELFREVWSTEYTGDTRTLDVHISWLRRVIEKDPRNPKFLITVRGIGYRLDV